MERLSKKLHSERGASLLLALLMLLVCMLVAASIMAAAASNAGKYRSNRVEQQKYLVLSSAIRLIADEIGKAKYTGKYSIYEWDDTDDDGNVTASHYYIKQVPGDYSCGDLTTQLPLGKELDGIFSTQFTGTGYTALSGADIETAPDPPRTLTVTLPDALDKYPDSGQAPYTVEKVVKVQVELNHTTRHIRLIAWLGTGDLADATDFMSAELVVKGSLAIDYNPGVREPGGSAPTAGPGISITKNGETAEAAGAPMKWELNWIKKGVA